ncbi:hypothetical protein HC928_07075, partial [bacterium]|nr:hypothetical protein [bacterium]
MTNQDMSPPPPRLPEYVGRSKEKDLLISQTRYINASIQSGCRVIYFEGDGGLGKTRLLQEYPAIVKAQASDIDIRVAAIIDFYEFVNSNPEVIETSLIKGLKYSSNTEQQWYCLPDAEVDDAFQSYTVYYHSYVQAQRSGSEERRTAYPERTLRELFIECWNKLTERYPLVMRFDTLEIPFQTEAPEEALTKMVEGASDEELILDWLTTVLPHLHRTLVLLSGRPLDKNTYPQHPLVKQLEKVTNTENTALLDATSYQILKPLETDEDIRAYLEASGVLNEALQHRPIEAIHTFTEGRPLLLAAYGEIVRPMTPLPPFGEFPRDDITKDEFKDYIVNAILHPINIAGREPLEQTLLRSFHILAVARKGVTSTDLSNLIERIFEPKPDENVVQHLHKSTFVKRVVAESTALLFLHDEIQLILDESGQVSVDKPGSIENADDILEALIELSKSQVQQRSQHRDGTEARLLLQAMGNHIYYALMRKPVQGYRTYTIYMNQLLGRRDVNGALVLSNTFWATLQTRAGKDRSVQQHLKQFERDGLYYNEITADEKVRFIKLLHAQDKHAEAVKWAKELREDLREQLERDLYFDIDLTLIEEQSRVLSEPFGEEAELDRIIALLQNDTPFTDKLLEMQRSYFLGNAYMSRSYLRYQEQRYGDALKDDEQARKAFEAYRPVAKEINDNVAELVAQANTNYAYNLLMAGEFKKARRVADKNIKDYAHLCGPYRQALMYNTDGLIRRARGELLLAQQAIAKAEAAAELSGNARARGMVKVARAQLHREISNRQQGVPSEDIDAVFAEAIDLLVSEPDQQREAYFQRAGLTREIAIARLREGINAEADHFKRLTLQWLDKALELLPSNERTMQHAEFIKSKAILHNAMEEYDPAESLLIEAEAILREITAPDYVHVICGKVAFQRGIIKLKRDREYQQALLLLTIGVARQYLYANDHRDLSNFKEQVESTLLDAIKEENELEA